MLPGLDALLALMTILARRMMERTNATATSEGAAPSHPLVVPSPSAPLAVTSTSPLPTLSLPSPGHHVSLATARAKRSLEEMCIPGLVLRFVVSPTHDDRNSQAAPQTKAEKASFRPQPKCSVVVTTLHDDATLAMIVNYQSQVRREAVEATIRSNECSVAQAEDAYEEATEREGPFLYVLRPFAAKFYKNPPSEAAAAWYLHTCRFGVGYDALKKALGSGHTARCYEDAFAETGGVHVVRVKRVHARTHVLDEERVLPIYDVLLQ